MNETTTHKIVAKLNNSSKKMNHRQRKIQLTEIIIIICLMTLYTQPPQKDDHLIKYEYLAIKKMFNHL
jgi:hypothetical protein